MLYAASLNREYEKLIGFIRLIRFIGTRIECFSQPLMTVYADFSDPALDSCGFTGALREDGFTTALCRCRDELCLDDAVFGICDDACAGHLGADAPGGAKRHAGVHREGEYGPELT